MGFVADQAGLLVTDNGRAIEQYRTEALHR